MSVQSTACPSNLLSHSLHVSSYIWVGQSRSLHPSCLNFLQFGSHCINDTPRHILTAYTPYSLQVACLPAGYSIPWSIRCCYLISSIPSSGPSIVHHHTPPSLQLQCWSPFHTPLNSRYYQMASATNPHDFPADSDVSSRSQYVPRQPWVRFDIGTPYAGAHSSCVLQAPPAPANGQPEGHREDIPPPIRGTAVGPAQEVDMAYQGIINYRPQPFAVSGSFRSTIGPPSINDTGQ